jgi:hypothetical protein
MFFKNFFNNLAGAFAGATHPGSPRISPNFFDLYSNIKSAAQPRLATKESGPTEWHQTTKIDFTYYIQLVISDF